MNMERELMKLWAIIFMAMLVKAWNGRKTPPLIKNQFADTYLARNSRAEFTCVASGYPTPKYEWKKNGVHFNNTIYVITDENTGKLFFRSIRSTDYGKYQCYARNELGTAISSVLELKEMRILGFSNIKKLYLNPVKEYSFSKIECKWKGSCEPRDECVIEWKRKSGITYNSIQESKRITIDRKGTLYFLYVIMADASNDPDRIACWQGIDTVKAFFSGGPIIMPVEENINAPHTAPILQYNADVTGLLYDKVTLQCIFSGYPVPSITWYKPNNQTITANYKYAFESYGRKLVIKTLHESDEGTYMCKAFNGKGTAKATVFLNVTSPPIFKSWAPKSLVVPEGSDAKFTCSLRSLAGEEPPTAPKWYRNEADIQDSLIGPNLSTKYQLRANKTELVVKDVKMQGDAASFTCVVGNVIVDNDGIHRYMETYSGATLTVREPIKVISSKTSIEIDTLKSFSMVVNATTGSRVTSLRFDWTFTRQDNSTEYDHRRLNRAKWAKFTGMNNLTIFPEKVQWTLNDEDRVRKVTGVYTVRVFNSYDTKFVKFVVFTNLHKERTRSLSEGSNGLAWWIILLIVKITVIITIVIIFIVFNYKKRRGNNEEVDADREEDHQDGEFVDLSTIEENSLDKIPYPLLETSDEDSVIGDYDDRKLQTFNEFGSFIGLYRNKGQSPNHH